MLLPKNALVTPDFCGGSLCNLRFLMEPRKINDFQFFPAFSGCLNGISSLHTISCMQDMVSSHLVWQSFPLVEMCSLFVFNVIINMIIFKSTNLIFVSYFIHLFCFCVSHFLTYFQWAKHFLIFHFISPVSLLDIFLCFIF